VRENYDQCQAVEIHLDSLTRRANYADSHPLVRAERESLERFKADMKKLSSAAQARHDCVAAARWLVHALEKYIPSLPPGSIALAPPQASPELAKGETPAQAVESLRARIESLREELQSAIDAPIHSSEAKKIARARVEQLAEMGRPNVLVTLEARRPPKFAENRPAPRVGHDSVGNPVSLTVDDSADALATMAWLFKDQMITAFEREIEAAADDESALSGEERASRIATAKAKMLKTERSEEAAIELAASSNRIVRRAAADPRAVLGLADSMPEPKSEG